MNKLTIYDPPLAGRAKEERGLILALETTSTGTWVLFWTKTRGAEWRSIQQPGHVWFEEA